jgi:hypothetical protein
MSKEEKRKNKKPSQNSFSNAAQVQARPVDKKQDSYLNQTPPNSK